MKRTISARADGAVCIEREAIPVGVFLIKDCTSADLGLRLFLCGCFFSPFSNTVGCCKAQPITVFFPYPCRKCSHHNVITFAMTT